LGFRAVQNGSDGRKEIMRAQQFRLGTFFDALQGFFTESAQRKNAGMVMALNCLYKRDFVVVGNRMADNDQIESCVPAMGNSTGETQRRRHDEACGPENPFSRTKKGFIVRNRQYTRGPVRHCD